MQRWMQAKRAKMAQVKSPKPNDHRRIAITSAEQLKMLRELGWREAYLHQVDNQFGARLAWFVYPNGMKRINIHLLSSSAN